MAATTELSTPPDIATTTRVSAGALASPRELSGVSNGMAAILVGRGFQAEYMKILCTLKVRFHLGLSRLASGWPKYLQEGECHVSQESRWAKGRDPAGWNCDDGGGPAAGSDPPLGCVAQTGGGARCGAWVD